MEIAKKTPETDDLDIKAHSCVGKVLLRLRVRAYVIRTMTNALA